MQIVRPKVIVETLVEAITSTECLAAFLGALGIGPRAARLSERANPAQKAEIDAALARLVGAEGMGGLFKVLCVAHPDQPAPAGFEA